ncbi:exoenzyme S synthesis protein C [Shewanella psychropiezotolerans]|uniref:Exoenzyme S synthesis protein C n=1 Tax=Shewanella psychropiezotolerans TaxID=2593655 RepID=A0ABX5X7F6_9GAMM|nr:MULTISPECIES: type III secretion system chaperone [Shewanella]MPY25684.1 exoenzyme S synthesis protein C [Shewanella sp. YLB-07]QDO86347.1 exoenzyme S synthesis protein C [Shewanella psychropiezotolerans]
MDVSLKINSILQNFGDSIGLTDLALKDNSVSLSFDDKLVVRIIYQAEKELLIFEAQITECANLDDAILRSLLAFNYHWSEHRLVFGLNLEEQQLCLYQHIDVETLDFAQFETILAEQVAQAERWAELLNIEDLEPEGEFERHHLTNISGIKV